MQRLLAIGIILLCFSFAPENDSEKILWSETEKLTWDDFQGTPKEGSDYVASTNSGISFSFSYTKREDRIDFDYTIESNFYPKLSWYKRGAVSDYILKHEQTHFDISELHSRMLRKEMETRTFSNNIKEEVQDLYQSIETRRKEMQRRYDKETDHSQISEAEFAWRDFVAEQLTKHERWK